MAEVQSNTLKRVNDGSLDSADQPPVNKQKKEEKQVVEDKPLIPFYARGSDEQGGGHFKLAKHDRFNLKLDFHFDVRFPTTEVKFRQAVTTPFDVLVSFVFNITDKVIVVSQYTDPGIDAICFRVPGRVVCLTDINKEHVPVVDGDYVFKLSATATRSYSLIAETCAWIPRVIFNRSGHAWDPCVKEQCFIGSSKDLHGAIAVHPHLVEFNAPALATALRKAYTSDAHRSTGSVVWLLDAKMNAIRAFMKAVLTGNYNEWFRDLDGKLLDAKSCNAVMQLCEQWLVNTAGGCLPHTPLYYGMRDVLPLYVKACPEPMDKARVMVTMAQFCCDTSAVGEYLDKAADDYMSEPDD